MSRDDITSLSLTSSASPCSPFGANPSAALRAGSFDAAGFT